MLKVFEWFGKNTIKNRVALDEQALNLNTKIESLTLVNWVGFGAELEKVNFCWGWDQETHVSK